MSGPVVACVEPMLVDIRFDDGVRLYVYSVSSSI